jgi:hypothetical protein
MVEEVNFAAGKGKGIDFSLIHEERSSRSSTHFLSLYQ